MVTPVVRNEGRAFLWRAAAGAIVPVPAATNSQDGDLTLDHTKEAVELRKAFRRLSLPSRRLVVDFAQMLAKQAGI